MLLLGIILLMLLLQGVVCPVPTYDAQGPALLFLEEGEEVLSLGGASFLMGITPGECADVCTYLGLACPTDDDQECCDSFSYRMIDQLCYLKKRGYNASMEVKFNSEGWTSYSYWGETSSVFPGGQYTGGQPIIVRAARVPNRLYRHAYVSQGPNQLAISEGQTIKNSKGRNFLGRVTPKDCADECDNTFQCDAFSYNPNQRQGIISLFIPKPRRNNVKDMNQYSVFQQLCQMSE
eukprot:TRINITY_DN3406_c0_g1_i5.p2 TRINITY_DN3406_c0_g1~~TRINITY_DN3406_c0_g1_i5.p2  ORF type:complete len:235 (-),score=20.43 TRINITY_DN3406_c0_g1_i5:283-987(-)